MGSPCGDILMPQGTIVEAVELEVQEVREVKDNDANLENNQDGFLQYQSSSRSSNTMPK